MLSRAKERKYPNLRAEGYEVTSEETLLKKVKYNCVAWAAMGDIRKWWQAPGVSPDHYWPDGILADDSFQSYIELFNSLRYEACTTDSVEIAYEKIALYAYPDGEFAHVSYQLFSGWTSKLGGWEDIKHKTLHALEEGDYGMVKLVMKRRCGLRGFLARTWFNATVKLWPLKRP